MFPRLNKKTFVVCCPHICCCTHKINYIQSTFHPLIHIMSNALSKWTVKDFLSGNDTWAEDIPLTNFLNAGDLTVESGNISSTTYSDIKLLVFASEIVLLPTIIHCLFACGATISTSSSFFFRFEVQLSSSVLHSISANAVVLCTVSRCFLKFEVVLRAVDNGFLLGVHKVHRKFFCLSLRQQNVCISIHRTLPSSLPSSVLLQYKFPFETQETKLQHQQNVL